MSLAVFVRSLSLPEDETVAGIRGNYQSDYFVFVVVFVAEQVVVELQVAVAVEMDVVSYVGTFFTNETEKLSNRGKKVESKQLTQIAIRAGETDGTIAVVSGGVSRAFSAVLTGSSLLAQILIRSYFAVVAAESAGTFALVLGRR